MTENADINGEKGNGGNALAPDKALLNVGAPVRVGKLNTLAHTRSELSRLYRECRRRSGRYPDALTGQRLSNILGALRESIVTDELGARIAALEAAAAEEKRS